MKPILSEVKKRDGSLDKFDINRIATAIKKAAESVNIHDLDLVKSLSLKVVDQLNHTNDPPTVEHIQDLIEKTLIEEDHPAIAKAYILYRQKRSEHREAKKAVLGRLEKLKLSETSLLIVKEKYLARDENGNIVETPEEMFHRVSKYVAQAEERYNKDKGYIDSIEKDFFKVMSALKFIPAGRILANASTNNKLLHSSFVLPIKDDIKEIFGTIAMQTTLQKYGAGVGFSFSKLRPKNSLAKTSLSFAAGPVAFIEVFNSASNVIKQVSSRKAANMASLSVNHPDIMEFISAKTKKDSLKNFNLSVEVTTDFMEAVLKDKKYPLINPIDNQVVDYIKAKDVFSSLVNMAWKNGDPGILFIDEINKDNFLRKLGRLEATDPCGDQPLLPNEGTLYGAINLSVFIKENDLDWDDLKNTIEISVRFLDNCIDLSETGYEEINKAIKSNRKISLGIMGFADMLYKLRIPYDSDDAVLLAEKISEFLFNSAYDASKKLGEEKGPFPNIRRSEFKDNLRNSSLLAISPTGSRSILANTSPGIEPNFSLGYSRKMFDGTEVCFVNHIFEDVAKKNNFYSQELIRKISQAGTIAGIYEIPPDLKDIFITAHEISPTWHLKIQAAFQQKIDNAVSKTINFPEDCTTKDIEKSIILAYNLGLKGLTVYRDKSREDQIINAIK